MTICLIEAAVNGHAAAVVTFNARHFVGVVDGFGIELLTPAALLRRSKMRTSSNYALRLPASLKRAVKEVARETATTLNQFIVSAVAEKLAHSRQRPTLSNALLALTLPFSIG